MAICEVCYEEFDAEDNEDICEICADEFGDEDDEYDDD